jgi:hypothetical protein
MTMDYSALARMWAKTLAYVGCGQIEKAGEWAQQLVDALRELGVEIK